MAVFSQNNRTQPVLDLRNDKAASASFVALACAALVVAGCHGPATSSSSAGTSTGIQPVASVTSMRGSDVVASVNSAPITAGELYDALQHFIPARVAGFPNNPDLNQPAGAAALKNLIISDVTVQFAQTSGVPVTPDELTASYNDQLMLQEAKVTLPFEAELQAQGYTADSYKQEVLAPQVAQFNILQKAENITPGDIQALYNTDQSQYTIPARVHLHRVVCASQQDAENVYSGIKGGRPMSDFAGVNLASGEGGNPADNTDLASWIDSKQAAAFGPKVAQLVLKSKVGDLLQPISIQGRWWVMQVVDTRPSQPLPFSQVSDLVRENLLRTKAAASAGDVQQQIFGALHSAQIQINAPQYQGVAMEVHMLGIGAPLPAQAPARAPVAPTAPAKKK